jgi:hypothetical protein
MKKQILFVESSATATPGKMAKAFKQAGYETILISLLPVNDSFTKEAYSKIISFDFKFFHANLKELPKIARYGLSKWKSMLNAWLQIRRLNPDILIARSTPNWLCYIFHKYFRKSLFIYFPYDFRNFSYVDRKQALTLTTPFELYSEKYCFENADGIIYKGAENKLDLINKKVTGELNIQAPYLHIMPYCLKNLIVPINKNKLSKKDGEIHLAFVGHIGTDYSWKNSVKLVLDSKIHLHLYGKSVYFDAKTSERRDEYSAFLKNKYFHLHKQLDQFDLVKDISKFDYGIWLGYYDNFTNSILADTGNKFATYLEAGLPVIYFDNHKYIGKSFSQYGAGIPININSNLGKILRSISKKKYQEMISKIEKGREKVTVEADIPRLIEFFKKALVYKNSK